MAKEVTRNELQEEALQEGAHGFVQFYKAHGQKIIRGVLVLLCLILAVVAIGNYQSYKQRKAQALFFEAQSQYENALDMSDATQRTEMLDAAQETFDEVARKYGGRWVGREALYGKGNCLLLKKQYKEAMDAFEQYREKAQNRDEEANAQLALAYALENKAFHEGGAAETLKEALETYEKAESLGAVKSGLLLYTGAEAILGQARIQEQLGNLKAAKDLYTKLQEKRAFYEEDLEAEEDPDMSQWNKLSREEKARFVRKQFLLMKSMQSYEKTAENAKKRLEAKEALQQAKNGA